MKAIIMAGGEGSRLRPLTCDIPKPMVPIMNKPIMEHIINLLKTYNITDIGVTLMYLPQKIIDYFGNGQDFDVYIKYFIDPIPLGTAGSVKNASSFVDGTFIVISGDSLTSIDLKKAVAFHKEKHSKATLILTRVNVPLEYGVVITNDNGRIKGFLEKPSWGSYKRYSEYWNIYILEPEIFNYFDSGTKFDFSNQLFPLLLEKNIPIYGYVSDDYWCDVGES